MNKENLTAEQKQAALVLENQFTEIQINLEWISKLSLDVSNFFYAENVQQYLSDAAISIEERFFKACKLLSDYDIFRIYSGILEHLTDDLKAVVDNIVNNVNDTYYKGTS